MAQPISSTHLRLTGAPFGIGRFALAGALLTLAGCGGFLAETRNAEGVRLYQQTRYQESLRQFQEAIYEDPKNADGYYNIAATYHKMGRQDHCESDLKQAEKFYNDCLDRNPNHVECHRGLAVLLAEQGRKAESFRLLQGWVDRQPTSAEAKVELARLNEEFGNRQAAKDNLIAALESQPDNPRALTALGKIREEAGDTTQALANYQRSLARDSRQPQVASRVKYLQTGVSSTGGAAAGPAGDLATPTVELGTRMADRVGETPK